METVRIANFNYLSLTDSPNGNPKYTSFMRVLYAESFIVGFDASDRQVESGGINHSEY